MNNWYNRIYDAVSNGASKAHEDLMGQIPPPTTAQLNLNEASRVANGNPTPVNPNYQQPPALPSPNWYIGEASLGGQYPKFKGDGSLDTNLRGLNFGDQNSGQANITMPSAAPTPEAPPISATPMASNPVPNAPPVSSMQGGSSNGFLQNFKDFMVGKHMDSTNKSEDWLGKRANFLQVLGDSFRGATGKDPYYENFPRQQYEQLYTREQDAFKNGETQRLNDANINNTNATTQGILTSNKYIAPLNDQKLQEAIYNNQILGADAGYADQNAKLKYDTGVANLGQIGANTQSIQANTQGQLIDNQYKPIQYQDSHAANLDNLKTAEFNRTNKSVGQSVFDDGNGTYSVSYDPTGKPTLTHLGDSAMSAKVSAESAAKLEEIKAKAKSAGLGNRVKGDGTIDWTGYPPWVQQQYDITGKLPTEYTTGEKFPYTAATKPDDYYNSYAAKHPKEVGKMVAAGHIINTLNQLYDLTAQYESMNKGAIANRGGRLLANQSGNKLLEKIASLEANLPQLAKAYTKIAGDNMSNTDVEVALRGVPHYTGLGAKDSGSSVRSKMVEASRLASNVFTSMDNEYGSIAQKLGVNIPEQFLPSNKYITPRILEALKKSRKK